MKQSLFSIVLVALLMAALVPSANAIPIFQDETVLTSTDCVDCAECDEELDVIVCDKTCQSACASGANFPISEQPLLGEIFFGAICYGAAVCRSSKAAPLVFDLPPPRA